MNTKLLTVLFVLCSFSLFAAKMHVYVLTEEFFDTDFANIDQDHLNAFSNGASGVGIEEVKGYLKNLAFEGNYASIDQEAPVMCLPKKDKDSLFVQVTGDYDTYHFSFFLAEDGNNETTISTSPKFAAHMEHDIFFTLLTIYGSTTDGRSSLYIIIIEKDFFTCNNTHYQYRDGRDKNNLRINGDQQTTEMDFNSFPNPATSHAQLSFHLEQSQMVSLDILNQTTGEIIARELENQYLLKGDHQLDVNLQSLPPGMYLLVLSTQHRRLSNLIVKAN